MFILWYISDVEQRQVTVEENNRKNEKRDWWERNKNEKAKNTE